MHVDGTLQFPLKSHPYGHFSLEHSRSHPWPHLNLSLHLLHKFLSQLRCSQIQASETDFSTQSRLPIVSMSVPLLASTNAKAETAKNTSEGVENVILQAKARKNASKLLL